MYTFMADLNYVYCKDAYSEQLNMVWCISAAVPNLGVLTPQGVN